MQINKISVFGLGNLGYPMALFLTKSKKKVFCYDFNKDLTNKLSVSKKNYLIYEKNLDNYNKIKIKICKSAFQALNGSNICFITVPTPSKSSGEFSNKYLLNCLNQICDYLHYLKTKNLNQCFMININSTVSPLSFKDELKPFMRQRGFVENKDYCFFYNPYFVALGNVILNLEKPDFVLIGHNNDKEFKNLERLYFSIYKKNLIKKLNLEEAVLVKLLVNCYVTNKISFTNFIADIIEKSNLKSSAKILDAIGSDKRIGKRYLSPGGPFSGPCFPRDNLAMNYFCKKIKSNCELTSATIKTNIQVKKKFYQILNFLKKSIVKNIGFLGISYKKNIESLQPSYIFELIEHAKKINLNVNFYDKYISKNVKVKFAKKFSSLDLFLKKNKIIFISYLDNFSEKKFIKYQNIIWDIHEIINSPKILTFNSLTKLKKLRIF
jgi:UDPglucose 6-dehydrogenase